MLKSKWQTAVIILLLIIPFNLYLFPARHNLLTRLSGRQDVTIDTWFAYTPQQVYDILPAYGQQGRLLYAESELSIDVIYPALYSTLLSLLMTGLFTRLLPAGSRLLQLKKLPFLLFSLDILENCGISAMLLTYPRRQDWLAWTTSFFTSAKFVVGAVGLVILLCAALAYAWVWLRRRLKS